MSGKNKKATQGSRRQFTEEFKKDAVQMLLDGHSAPSIVDRLTELMRDHVNSEAYLPLEGARRLLSTLTRQQM